MGKYISRDDVALRLTGKVLFTDDLDDENKMPFKLLDRLIAEAEGDVEHDLTPRYSAPFEFLAADGSTGSFKSLPASPTREILRTLCEIKAVLRVLETDFGRGTIVEADKYSERIAKRYDAMYNKLMEKKKHGGEESGWKYPPLPGLKPNYMNTEADDGFAGMPMSTTRSDGEFPADRINNPSQSFWNATVDEEVRPNLSDEV